MFNLHKIKKASLEEYEFKYPKVESSINGFEILNEIPNIGSISASFDDYKILDGIREIPVSEFSSASGFFYSKDDWEHSRNLAEKIKQNQQIKPLIVAIDNEGPYILEGAHRFVALSYLNTQSIPALVVLDLD